MRTYCRKFRVLVIDSDSQDNFALNAWLPNAQGSDISNKPDDSSTFDDDILHPDISEEDKCNSDSSSHEPEPILMIITSQIQQLHVSKSSLRESKFQTFPGEHAPRPP